VVGVAPSHVDRDAQELVIALIEELRTDRVPLLAPRRRRAAHWVDEGFIAAVRYLERTPTGLLRQPTGLTMQASTKAVRAIT
jgi:hypothetical protein